MSTLKTFNDIFVGSVEELKELLDGEGFKYTDIESLAKDLFEHYDNVFVTDGDMVYVSDTDGWFSIWMPMCWDEFDYDETFIMDYIKDFIEAEYGIEMEYGFVIDTFFNNDKAEYIEAC